jgi:hypothetical protein
MLCRLYFFKAAITIVALTLLWLDKYERAKEAVFFSAGWDLIVSGIVSNWDG